MTTIFPLTLKMSVALIHEFALCEEGAHEDGEQTTPEGVSAYDILTRRTGLIEVRNAAEADLLYYAACSGTFGLMGQGDPHDRAGRLDDARRNRAANRIADWLRPHATAETVRRWRNASGY